MATEKQTQVFIVLSSGPSLQSNFPQYLLFIYVQSLSLVWNSVKMIDRLGVSQSKEIHVCLMEGVQHHTIRSSMFSLNSWDKTQILMLARQALNPTLHVPRPCLYVRIAENTLRVHSNPLWYIIWISYELITSAEFLIPNKDSLWGSEFYDGITCLNIPVLHFPADHGLSA